MDLQRKALCKSFTGTELNPNSEAHAVSDIVTGLCENLKNIHNYRLFMHEEIKDILKRQMVTVERKVIPDSWTLTREED